MVETTGTPDAMSGVQGAIPDPSTTEPPPATGDPETLGEGGKAALEQERTARRDAERRAKSLEIQVAKFQAAQQVADAANLSELDKAKKRIAELEHEQSEFQVREQDRNVRLAAVEAATRLNFRNPDLAHRLLDRSEVEFADDGHPKNVAKLLKEVLERDPYLAKSGQPDYGGGQRGPAPTDKPTMNELLRAAARGG